MICLCGNQNATRIHGGWYEQESGERVYQESCEACGQVSALFMPDVYWDGKPDTNLADDPKTGQPPVFLSKGHKARYLRERGLNEAGDKVHGAPKSYEHVKPGTDSREAVRQALAAVKGMGQAYRRQEFLRIKKEAENRW